MEFVPPSRVFQTPPKSPVKRLEEGTYDLPGFLHPTRTKTGGMASVFQGHPYPRKGFIYSEAVIAINKAKRVTLMLFEPWRGLKKGLTGFLEEYFKNYVRLVDSLFQDYERIPYLKYEYYSEFSKVTWDFTFLFLRNLGISFDTSYKVGLILATILENDDAYKVRIQDLLSESSVDLLQNPRKELDRLFGLYVKREDPAVQTELAIKEYGKDYQLTHGIGKTFKSFFKLLRFALLIPRVKKAFLKSLNEINFKWFQNDEIDHYWSLNRFGYDPQGRKFEDRMEEQVKLMEKYIKKTNPDKEVVRQDMPNGSVNINII